MAQYLDADDLFLITKQGFDFFHEQFGVRYPLPKYDQLWVPDFNAGAMENFGCVTHAESHYIFRSQVTDFEYEQRANTILHELAHMWFGDLVTMRWWDDLWLNESFAEWACHWCNTDATRFTDAWTTFLSIRKNWGYRQDQLSSHPPGLLRDARRGGGRGQLRRHHVRQGRLRHQAARRVRRASTPFRDRPARLLRRATPGATPPSTTCSPRWRRPPAGELREFAAAVAGDRAGQHAAPGGRRSAPTARTPAVVVRAGGAGRATRRCVPTGSASASTTCADGRLVRRDRLELDVAGERTDVAALVGVRAAGRAAAQRRRPDLRQAAARRALDGHRGASTSPASTRRWPGRCAGPPPGTWSATPSWPPATTSALVCAGLPAETRHQPGHRHAAPGQPRADPVRRPGLGADRLGSCSPTPPATALAAAEPGSGFQLAWARAFAAAARTRRRTWPCCAAGSTARTCRTAWPSTPSCAGRCCRRWSPTARPARPRSTPSWTATGRPAASARRRWPARWCRRPSPRPRSGAG